MAVNVALLADGPPMPPGMAGSDSGDENSDANSTAQTLVRVLATDPYALVGTSTAAFTFIRDGATNADLAIPFDIRGSGSNGVDYATIPNALTIPAGFFAADLLVTPKINPANRGNKTLTVAVRTNALYHVVHNQKATVTLVDDTYNFVPPTVSITSPADGTVYTLPVNVTIQAQAVDTDGDLKRVGFYANDKFLGYVTNSPFVLIWTNPPPGAYNLFARATDQLGKSTLSDPVDIVVTNARPTIKLLSPIDGSVMGQPVNVTITAEASDTDDNVVKVQIYEDGKLKSTLTNSPYSIVWTNVPAGKHEVMARATDTYGLTASTTVRFSVTNAFPSVKITAPVNGADFRNSERITLQAEATDADGTIKEVGFWANHRFLGSVTKAPYTITWKKTSVGAYSITAVATDNDGAHTTSPAVLISVSK